MDTPLYHMKPCPQDQPHQSAEARCNNLLCWKAVARVDMAILHKDISHWVGTYVEPDCLARLAAACRGLVTPHLWQCRADQLWPGLELELCDGDADGLGFRAFDRAFRALHAGCRGRASQVDAARARQVLERALEAPREAPRNKVLLTLYHGATVLARGCSSITLYDQEPSGRAAERAQFELNVGHLRQLLDSWLDRHICIQRSLSRQLLVSFLTHRFVLPFNV